MCGHSVCPFCLWVTLGRLCILSSFTLLFSYRTPTHRRLYVRCGNVLECIDIWVSEAAEMLDS